MRDRLASLALLARRRPRWLALLAAAGLVLLASGHWLFHYQARFRPATPAGPEAALLDVPWAEVAVWVPFPHQNFAALERRAGLVPASGSDVLTLAELETPRLPSFGGMLSPPARSLALASGENGQLAVAVSIYPTFAAFARLAGFLAKNPWLGGGELTWRGRRVQVAWRDGLWLAGSPSLPDLDRHRQPLPESSGAASPSILVVHARRPAEPLPAGRYRLRLEAGDLVLRSAAADGLERDPQRSLDRAALESSGALLLISSQGRRARTEARAMALFAQPGGAITELPRAAALHRGEQRYELPAESLLELAGRDFQRGERAGYALLATDPAALEGASALADALAARLDGPVHDLDIWLRLAPAADEVGRLCRGFEQAPFLSKKRLRSWQSAERLLRGLAADHASLHLEVPSGAAGERRGRALVLRIERRAAAGAG